MDNSPAPKHTPGPWIESGFNVRSRSDEGIVVAKVRSVNDIPLIASAPDLLAERDRLKALNATLVAALEDAVHNLEHGYTISPGGTILPRFRAALEAAKGVKS